MARKSIPSASSTSRPTSIQLQPKGIASDITSSRPPLRTPPRTSLGKAATSSSAAAVKKPIPNPSTPCTNEAAKVLHRDSPAPPPMRTSPRTGDNSTAVPARLARYFPSSKEGDDSKKQTRITSKASSSGAQNRASNSSRPTTTRTSPLTRARWR
ncbi:hypothetical protein V5O48_013164 [Marasmius crinis-equi]|uniref:Uncharacterized protein n=1 Tax=Marasmius crinis-equi TaxID=585013 RepID=A0ABR3F0W2_9AGAR